MYCYYKPTKIEYEHYRSIKPSFAQFLVNIVWPLKHVIKWKYYQTVKIHECM